MIISLLQVDHITDPLGYRMTKPVFSYVISRAEGAFQKAGRVLISLQKNMSDPIYDSGLVVGMDPKGFEADITLSPRTRYYYRIYAVTDAGDGAWSEVRWFETGKGSEPWKAAFITCEKKEKRLPVFSKTVKVRKPVKKARLYICGLGLYEAFIGTKRVGDEYLTPYCNDYDAWLQVQTFDVGDLLKKSSTLSVTLGNGWFKGRFGFDPKKRKGTYGDSFALIAELHIHYTDGEEDVIGTDNTWTVTRSNTTFSNIYDGEQVDMTLEALPKEKARLWKAPRSKEDPMKRLTDRLSVPVRVMEHLKPIEKILTPAGEQVLDIGQEITGSFELKVNEPKGTRIRLQFGEILQNGNFFNQNLRSAKAEFVYISSGKRTVIRPKFTFYGYRYVKIEGIEKLDPSKFTALAMWSDIKPIGTVKTGNDKINRLLENIQWGQKDNFLDVPTDCPQRDERMGWTGDAEVFAPTASLFMNTQAFYRKYIYDMNQEQKTRDGGVPHVVPSFNMPGSACAWADAVTIIPWTVYETYGDASFLKDSFEGMKAWVDYVDRLEKDHHQWRDQFHFGDWLALDSPYPAPSPLGLTDTGFLAECYFLYSARLTAKAAKVLGKNTEADHYQTLAEEILQYIRSEYFSKTGRCTSDTQTSHLMNLWLHLTPEDTYAREGLLRQLSYSQGKLRTGFIGTPLLCRELSKIGHGDMAYDLLFNEDYPGWLYEVNNGATTIWERWNSVLPDGHLSDLTMNSLNHYAYGAIAEWIFTWCTGLMQQKDSVGYQKIVFRPHADKRMKQMEVSYQSASGLWKLGWKISGKSVKCYLTVPFGCEAIVELPGIETKTVNCGTYQFQYKYEKTARE